MRASDPVWSVKVPVEEVSEAGRHYKLVADAPTRAALAKAIGLRDLPRLVATFDLTRRGRDGLHVTGRVLATVGQDCVVTLEPMESEVAEDVDLAFSPKAKPESEAVVPLDLEARDPPEPLVNGQVDLGAIATEFLMLGIDSYPRKADADFAPPRIEDPTAHPFAALAALKKGKSEENR
jgi:hypothetical protein